MNKGDKTWLINGEAKPGLRTDAVFELDFTGNNLNGISLLPSHHQMASLAVLQA